MNRRKTDRSKPLPKLPALRNFLRGYLHQDMRDEYGSAEGALRQFLADASADERVALARDWASLLESTQGQSLDTFNALLTGSLGSSYSVSAQEIQQLTAILETAKKNG